MLLLLTRLYSPDYCDIISIPPVTSGYCWWWREISNSHFSLVKWTSRACTYANTLQQGQKTTTEIRKTKAVGVSMREILWHVCIWKSWALNIYGRYRSHCYMVMLNRPSFRFWKLLHREYISSWPWGYINNLSIECILPSPCYGRQKFAWARGDWVG